MIQIRYRSRFAKQRAQRLKQEAFELKLTGYARKLQFYWRLKQARRHIEKMKAQRAELALLRSVTLVQCLWRKRKARSFLSILRGKRVKEKLQLAAEEKKVHAQGKIMWFLIMALARFRARKALLTSQMHSIHITVISGHDLLVGNLGGKFPPSFS